MKGKFAKGRVHIYSHDFQRPVSTEELITELGYACEETNIDVVMYPMPGRITHRARPARGQRQVTRLQPAFSFTFSKNGTLYGDATPVRAKDSQGAELYKSISFYRDKNVSKGYNISMLYRAGRIMALVDERLFNIKQL